MEPDTTSVIRDVFLIVAAGLLSVLCLTIIIVIVKLYWPIRDTVMNSHRTAENLSKVTGDISRISQETCDNIAQTSRNLVNISGKAQESAEEISDTVHSVKKAAGNIASTASTATRVMEMVARLIPQGTGGATSGVGTLLRLVRGLFNTPKGSGNPGTGN